MSRDVNRGTTHPGEPLLQDVFPAAGQSKVEVSRLPGMSRQHLHDIFAEGKPASPEAVERRGKLFGIGSGFWIQMQGASNEWHVSRKVDVSGIPTLQFSG